MRLRQAKKIMKNFQLYPGMLWIYGTGRLEEMITTETPTETRIMSIYVQSTSPKQAKQLADAVRNAVSVQIKQIMNVDSVNTVEEANLPMYPSSPSTKKNMLIGGLLGILASVGIVLFVYLSDDTLKTPADIERYLD